MAITNAARPRAPRGTKILTQAFFAALDDIPEMQQEAVSKAALVAIKEQLQLRRHKARLLVSRARGPFRPEAANLRRGKAAASPRA